ncbi:MAG TPA: SDR family NAD(P)-dependent oxidoreductase [Acidobacteriota bacterium]|nr:SDR family NAD(P)-dependent oxidoreductase [Acidobacteriota bacterium]
MPGKRGNGRVALVTGANRGIGLEVCRQLGRLGNEIIMTGRDPRALGDAASLLARESLTVHPELMDVSSRESVRECGRRLGVKGIRVDVLVNNAGVYPPGDLLSVSEETIREAMEINFLGSLRTAQAFLPGMLQRNYGRVVNISSGYGSFAEGLEGPAPYSLSKAALNAMTLKLASEVRGNVKVNAACPGWVRTRMGGPEAPRSVEEGADTIVWLATLPDDGPSGGLFRDRQQVDW